MTTTNAPASLHRSATQTRTAGCTELDQAPEPSSGSAFGLDQIGETTTLAVSYLRVSTKEQASKGGRDEGFSIPAQREANLRKAQGLNAIIIEEFVDAGESARKADRPALMELIEYVKTHPVAYCIVHKVDRLARNRADDVAIHLALKEAGVLLVSATENIDETPSGMLLHGIMSTIAEFYSRNLANEVSKGMTQKAITGGTNGKAPMGYLNVTRRDELGRELRTIEVDPHRGPLIRWASEAYATGNYSTATLREELIDRGLTTVATPKRPARPPALSSIQRMLSSPYYKGNVLFKGATYDGLHEPLVAPEIWYRVQTVLAAHQVSGEKTQAHDHYLKGSVFCGICGSRLILTNAKSRRGVIYPYFICSGRHKKRTNCNRKAMFVPDVEAAVEDYYRTVQIPAHIIGPLRELIHAEFDRLHATAKTERKAQIAERDRLYDERHKLLQAHYAGAVPLDLLKSEQDRIGLYVQMARIQDDRLGRPTEAVGSYRKVLDLDPSSLLALRALDDLFTRQRQWPELAENLEQQLAITDDAERQIGLMLRLAALRERVALLLEWGRPLPQDPAALARRIKALPLRHAGPMGLERAISSAGGITAAALTPDLELRALPGVFAAGEMLDWEAPTGGYLLTTCLATGRHAGQAAARRLGRAGGLAGRLSRLAKARPLPP